MLIDEEHNDALLNQRRGSMLDDWRRKRHQLRQMVEGLEDIQRRSTETRRKIDAALDRMNAKAEVRNEEPSQSVAFHSPSPPKELTTCATQTFLADEGGEEVGGMPLSFARLAARSRSRIEAQPSDWATRRRELKKFFDERRASDNVSPSHEEKHPTAGSITTRTASERKDRSKSDRAAAKKDNGIGGVVEGLMAAAMPTLVDNAQRMRKAADRFTSNHSNAKTKPMNGRENNNSPKPSRDDVLLDRCRHMFATDSHFAFLKVPPLGTAPRSSTSMPVRVSFKTNDSQSNTWLPGEVVLEDNTEPRHLWIVGTVDDKRVPHPTCLDIGAWRGHVVDTAPDQPFCVALQARFPHSGGHPITCIMLELTSFEDLEHFVESVKHGQRRIAAEWST